MFVVVTAKYLGGSLSLSRSHHATRLSPKTSHDFLGVKHQLSSVIGLCCPITQTSVIEFHTAQPQLHSRTNCSSSHYRPKAGDALRLGSKGRYGSCVWQVKLCDPLVTHGPYLSALEMRSLYIKRYINLPSLLCFTLQSVLTTLGTKLHKASVSQWSSIHFHPRPHLKRFVHTIRLAT